MEMGWKSVGNRGVAWNTGEKPVHWRQTDNGYRGVSQRPLATLSGDSGRAYRRDLTSGAAYQTVNVGGPDQRPGNGLD